MKTAVLFSGGKDSCLALHYALKDTEVMCLITMISESNSSYMFHTPNINLAQTQAKAIGLPIIVQRTKGVKEKELKDLELAISRAKKEFGITGIVTGAIGSVYQASRIQALCSKLDLVCFNPLWQRDQIDLLMELVRLGFDVILTGVYAEGLGKFLGRRIDANFIADIKKVQARYRINPAGEGGEFESLTLYAPYFKSELKIIHSHVVEESSGGRTMVISDLK